MQRTDTYKRQTSKLKFLLLIIQIWKPPNIEEEKERAQPHGHSSNVGTIMQVLK